MRRSSKIDSSEGDQHGEHDSAITLLRFVIVLTGLFMPLLTVLAVRVHLCTLPPQSYLRDYYAINPESCFELFVAGLLVLTWWPFAVYAILVRKLYIGFLDEGSSHPSLIVLSGLLGLALPASVMWLRAFPFHPEQDHLFLALDVTIKEVVFQVPTAFLLVTLARWVTERRRSSD